MPHRYFLTALLILIVTAAAAAAISARPVPAVVETNLEKLPMVIGPYTATEDAFSDEVYRELNADKHVYRHYRDGAGNVVDLYIGYYGTAKGGRTGHNPYACLPGAGAAIVETGTVTLRQAPQGEPVPVNYILSKNNGTSTVMLHWYQSAGNIVMSSGWRQNWERFRGRVLHNRNDGAYVQISASVMDGNVPKALQRLAGFSCTVTDGLSRCWPREQE